MQNSQKDRESIRYYGKKVFRRHRNFYVYIIFGFLAAVINTIVFMVMHQSMHIQLIVANTVAFIIANLASFYFNQVLVFVDNKRDSKIWKKLLAFFTFRVISLIPDNLIMLVGLGMLRGEAFWVKIIDQILVGIFNYLTTRLVFIKQDHQLQQRIRERRKNRKR